MKTFKTLQYFRKEEEMPRAIDNAFVKFLKKFKRKPTIELFCSYVYNKYGYLKKKAVRIAYTTENSEEVVWFENHFKGLVEKD